MKRLLLLALAGLPVLALPAPAQANGGAIFNVPPYKIDVGVNAYFKVTAAGAEGGPLAPWYTYFPYEAYFQTPAPTGHYPNWPPPMTSTGYHLPQFAPQAAPPNPIQPTGYRYYPQQAPSYWYGR